MTEPVLPVAFVDDDAQVRSANAQTLQLAGFKPLPFASAAEALEAVDGGFAGIVVTDLRMPRMDGMQLFRRLNAMDPDLPVILVTGHGDIATAVEAMREGVYDFLSKPFAADQLIRSVTRAVEKRALVMENRKLFDAAQQAATASPIIGDTPAIRRLRETLRAVADADVDILLVGETGTGKEVVARELHRLGQRRQGAFVALNCGALPETVIDSELFGHEAGAFTGAQKKRVGLIEHSSKGTLFLDEVESMPPNTQVRLLRVLEGREVMPVGTNMTRAVDLRVVAAAKVDLGAPERRAEFREDLYHRLNVVTIRIPPLRERRDDIALLFAHLLERAAKRFQRRVPVVPDALRQYLDRHDWPGNVRELGHFAERFVLGLTHELDAADPVEPAKGTLPERVDAYEARLIREALAAHKGDVRLTVAALGIPRKTFYDKLQRYDINRASFEA
ncbi:sigma-54 dependent transcriptional regulator [Acidocella sp.]|uniref:sigma-54-dependent transcriptional regulator n=1 Tax=Acidocella sp. TaxID=50710 RepID=UPI0026090BF2|nr:sigma-54 dependent transcriptional regulator [Acidocella sp.]